MAAWRIGEASVRVLAIRLSDFSSICGLGSDRDEIPGSDDTLPRENQRYSNSRGK